MRPQLIIAAERDQDEIDERRCDHAGDDEKESVASGWDGSHSRGWMTGSGARRSAAAFTTGNEIVPAGRRGR